jgi:leader peptidase (prepilin peptidase)/N-methyltransferase
LFIGGLFSLAIIDLDTLTLPRSIVWVHLAIVGTGLFAYTAGTGHWRHLLVGVLCGLAWSGVYLVIHFISPRSMGFGDVRLGLVLGLGLGYINVAYVGLAFILANLVGVVVTLGLIASKKLRRDQPVPYGVFLATGAAIVFYSGPWLTQPFRYPYTWW